MANIISVDLDTCAPIITGSMEESNVEVGLIGDKIVLVIQADVDLGPSKSGKMNAVASTGGFTKLPNGMSLNLWLGKKIKP